jgi:hypothetical protein
MERSIEEINQRIEAAKKRFQSPRSGRPAKEVTIRTRYCLFCAAPLRRKMRSDGRQETWDHFLNRWHCNKQCRGKHMTGRSRGWTPRYTPKPDPDAPISEAERLAIQSYGIALDYGRGDGATKIARRWNVSESWVYRALRLRHVVVRPVARSGHPSIEWNGRKYYYNTTKGCYFRAGRRGESKTYLSRDVWEFHYGPIPEGYEIRHLDRNAANNAIENLVCVNPVEGARLHSGYKDETALLPVRHCQYCGLVLERKRSEAYTNNGGWEPFHAFARRRFCGLECAGAAQRGKPKNWSPDNPVEREYPVKYCLACGEQLKPRVYTGKMAGVIEPLSAFTKRQMCNQQCAGAYRKGKPRK